MTLCGEVAQRHAGWDRSDEYHRIRCGNDRKQLMSVLDAITETRADGVAMMREMISQAHRIIEAHWHVLEELARELLQYRPVPFCRARRSGKPSRPRRSLAEARVRDERERRARPPHPACEGRGAAGRGSRPLRLGHVTRLYDRTGRPSRAVSRIALILPCSRTRARCRNCRNICTAGTCPTW